MTEKLDNHAPTLARILGTRRQLLLAGISEEAVNSIKDWLPAILAAEEKWETTTDEGLNYIANALGFNMVTGEDDKSYTLVDNINRVSHSLKNSQVMFFSGALVNGKPIPLFDSDLKELIPPLELEISEKTKNQCEDCGIVSHCLKEVLEPYSERLKQLCNRCLTFHDHPKVNNLGGFDVCRGCSVNKCQHHPKEERTKLFG